MKVPNRDRPEWGGSGPPERKMGARSKCTTGMRPNCMHPGAEEVRDLSHECLVIDRPVKSFGNHDQQSFEDRARARQNTESGHQMDE
jgi:hypothetical protein